MNVDIRPPEEPLLPPSDRRCNACRGARFTIMGRRSDKIDVLRCIVCGLGIVERVPLDLKSYYGDAYYGFSKTDEAVGYGNYQFTAEHGVSWAAAIVQLIKPGGSVLDIGCAEGTLLRKLPDNFERYGIEMNERMAANAVETGICILGHDLLDPGIIDEHQGRFDVVTSIAVFEHLPDLRRGVQVALDLLKSDGVLLFEMPYISAKHDNRFWFESSLEHVFYPSGNALGNLIEDLGAYLVGGELYIRDFASNYIGFAFRDQGLVIPLQQLFDTLTSTSDNPPTVEGRRARQQLMLVHAAESTCDLISGLADLFAGSWNQPLLQRFEQLWSTDLRRLAALKEERDDIAQARDWQAVQSTRLAAACEALASERDWQAVQSTRLAAACEALASEIAVAKSDYQSNLDRLLSALDSSENAKTALERELSSAKAEGEALRNELNTILNSIYWKISYPLRQLGALQGRTAFLLCQGKRTARRATHLESFSRLRKPKENRRAVVAEVREAALPGLPPLAISQRNGVIHPIREDDEEEPWPTDRPLVSVVVTAFNYGEYAAGAVDSVLAQTFANLEVIVVEGGSTSAKSRRLTFSLDRPRTRVLAQDGPHLTGANRNLGISHARGKYICCLDADDLLAPTYIEKAVFLLEAYGYDVISTATQFFGNRNDRVNILESPTLSDMLEGNHMLTCAVFRRSLWRRAGGYRDTEPEVTGYVFEDWMFWTRLAALGAKMHNICREHMFLYRSHGPSNSTRPNLHPEPVQRALILQANADLIGPETIVRSKQAAAELRLIADPLRNLVQRTDKTHAKQPVLLLSLPFTILGGAERLLSRVAGHLADHGWRLLITTSIDPGPGHGDTTHWFESTTHEIYHLPRFLAPNRWPEFVRYLLASRAVNVLWVAGSAFMYELLPELRAGFPQLRVVDLLFNATGHTGNNRKYADSIDLTFVENQEVLRFLCDAGEEETRISLVPSGVDLDAYQPGPRDSVTTEELHATPDDLIIGFSGRWSEEKDPLAFVEIARRMPSHLPVRFVMTGTGVMRGAIEDALGAAAMPNGRFCLRGEVADVKPWLRSYDVLVLPSRLDGRPVVVLEAMALGVPVVASSVGALPELVQHGINGFLCRPGAIDDFVNRLLRLVNDRPLLARMKEAVRRYAELNLDSRAMMNSYEDQLRTLAKSSVDGEKSR
jgi:glycosyltransferase involved in cell wall biosynthesis/SAM-dependent methyltransferase